MVPPDSDRIPPVPPYSGYCQVYKNFRIQGYHLILPTFPGNSTNFYKSFTQSYNPKLAVTTLVWAVSRSLATTWEIIIIFFSSAYLDVSVQRVRLLFQGYPVFNGMGCPIRVSADRFVLADPRGFSQLATPFVAYRTQGIPRAPFSYSFPRTRRSSTPSHAPLRPQTSKIFWYWAKVFCPYRSYATRIRCGRLPRGAKYLLGSAARRFSP